MPDKLQTRLAEVLTFGSPKTEANLGDRPEVRSLFLALEERMHLPDLLPRSRPVDMVVDVNLYLPGCPPTPELYMAVLRADPEVKIARTVCQKCGRKKDREMRPEHLFALRKGEILPDICLINQGFLCVGSSTRGGCRALCTIRGYPCVGCREPSDSFIEKESEVWLSSVQRTFERMTDVEPGEIEAALRSPQLSLFLFRFADYADVGQQPRQKEQVV